MPRAPWSPSFPTHGLQWNAFLRLNLPKVGSMLPSSCHLTCTCWQLPHLTEETDAKQTKNQGGWGQVSSDQLTPGYLLYIGNDILPSYMRIISEAIVQIHMDSSGFVMLNWGFRNFTSPGRAPTNKVRVPSREQTSTNPFGLWPARQIVKCLCLQKKKQHSIKNTWISLPANAWVWNSLNDLPIYQQKNNGEHTHPQNRTFCNLNNYHYKIAKRTVTCSSLYSYEREGADITSRGSWFLWHLLLKIYVWNLQK